MQHDGGDLGRITAYTPELCTVVIVREVEARPLGQGRPAVDLLSPPRVDVQQQAVSGPPTSAA